MKTRELAQSIKKTLDLIPVVYPAQDAAFAFKTLIDTWVEKGFRLSQVINRNGLTFEVELIVNELLGNTQSFGITATRVLVLKRTPIRAWPGAVDTRVHHYFAGDLPFALMDFISLLDYEEAAADQSPEWTPSHSTSLEAIRSHLLEAAKAYCLTKSITLVNDFTMKGQSHE